MMDASDKQLLYYLIAVTVIALAGFATYHVNPKLHNELATTMCEFLEGKRK